MISTTKSRLTVALLVIATGAACGGGRTAGTGLTGAIDADGSSTVFPITDAIREEFVRDNTGVSVSVGTSGTGGGFEKFCSSDPAERTDLQDASRPIKTEADPGETAEADLCEAAGVQYVELTVARDGLAVVVNASNDFVDCLTTEELAKIWGPGSTITNWSQVRDGFPDLEMKLYGPGTDSGTFDYFTDEIMGEEGAIRSPKDWTPSENDNELVTGVAGADGGLGYFGYAYYAENTDKLKVLGVDAGSGCVEPSDETVQSGDYAPLSRPLFVYVSEEAAGRPEVAAFIDFYLENVNALVGDVGYTPLSDEELATEVAEWESLVGA